VNDLEQVLASARRQLRDMTAERSAVAAEREASRKDASRAALAAAEALEIVEGSLAALVERLENADAGPRLTFAILAAAWERLEGAGVCRDGVPGEPIDPSRHRVVESRGPEGGARVVARVVKPGLRLNERRIREAWVVAGPEEEGNG
jgi:molecular chaperone GrpE (heat shock protein)